MMKDSNRKSEVAQAFRTWCREGLEYGNCVSRHQDRVYALSMSGYFLENVEVLMQAELFIVNSKSLSGGFVDRLLLCANR